jgi:hypothetical protein
VDVAIIFALAGALAVVPALVDRWALPRGAAPESLAALAAITLLGVVAVPLSFAICTGFLAAHDHGADALSAAALSGLLLVAVLAGRTTARMLHIRRRWSALSRLAAALQPREDPSGVKVLPVGELLAFVSGTEAFISQGLIDRLTPAQSRAVIEHEREHAERKHARLLSAARAVSHGTFGLHPASHAAEVLDRELDALADRAAARRLGDRRAVYEALRTLADATSEDGRVDSPTRARIERLSTAESRRRPLIDAAVRFATLALGALLLASICVSIHAALTWLGVTACVLFLAGFVSLARPVLQPQQPSARPEELSHA